MTQVTTSDQQVFQVPSDVANQIGLFKHMHATQVTLKYVDGQTFRNILMWLNGNQEQLIVNLKTSGNLQEGLFKLINAADFLNMPECLDYMCKVAASELCHGKSPSELRQMFGLQQDLSKEHEERILKQATKE